MNARILVQKGFKSKYPYLHEALKIPLQVKTGYDYSRTVRVSNHNSIHTMTKQIIK